jgi:site-specific DNA recombinase
MRALGYFTYDQADSDSLTEHEASYARFCTEGRHIDNGVFFDVASETERGQWVKMVEKIEESGLGYLVIVPSAAHLGSTLRTQVRAVLDLDSLLCQVVCNNPDRPDPLQNALRPSGATQTRGEKIREGMRAKAAKGLGLGKPPYGYKIIWDGTFRVVEPEALVVRAMFERYSTENGGVRAVATWLNESRYKTRRGLRWSMVTVRDILRNSAYIGTYHRFGLRLPAAYEAIVERDVFRAVQEKMQGRSPVRRNPKGEPFLLSGIIYCGYCGQRMMGITRHQMWRRKDGQRARAQYRYYQCQSRVNRNLCEYRTVNASELERQVVEKLRAGLATVDATRENLAEVGDDWMAARIGSIERRFRLVVERAASGGMSLAQLRVETVEAETALRAAQAQRDLIGRGSDGMRELTEMNREQLDLVWEDLDINEQQDVLRTLVSKVVVEDGIPQVQIAGS